MIWRLRAGTSINKNVVEAVAAIKALKGIKKGHMTTRQSDNQTLKQSDIKTWQPLEKQFLKMHL
jgi:hypothetical protein